MLLWLFSTSLGVFCFALQAAPSYSGKAGDCIANDIIRLEWRLPATVLLLARLYCKHFKTRIAPCARDSFVKLPRADILTISDPNLSQALQVQLLQSPPPIQLPKRADLRTTRHGTAHIMVCPMSTLKFVGTVSLGLLTVRLSL